MCILCKVRIKTLQFSGSFIRVVHTPEVTFQAIKQQHILKFVYTSKRNNVEGSKPQKQRTSRSCTVNAKQIFHQDQTKYSMSGKHLSIPFQMFYVISGRARQLQEIQASACFLILARTFVEVFFLHSICSDHCDGTNLHQRRVYIDIFNALQH